MAVHESRNLNFLAVEDDDLEWLLLQRSLTSVWKEPHQLFHVTGVKAALELLKMYRIDVILLDLNVTDSQGTQTVETIKAHCNPACIIIVSTSMKDKATAITALNKGAHDFIVKGEYSPTDLARAIDFAIARNSNTITKASHPLVKLDSNRLKLISNVSGKNEEVNLTAIEFKVASLLVAKIGQAVSREELVSHVLGPEASTSERTADNQVSRLRTKLKDIGLNVSAVRGVGYRMDIEKKLIS